MESILVTPENLRAQAGKVDNKAQEYYSAYQALLSEVETLTSTDWTGEDAQAFLAKVRDFEPDFNKMRELMEQYATFLRQAAQNYVDTQSNIKNTIQSLQS